MSKIVKIKLTIDGMHCASCAMNIDFDLEDMKGVISAKTHYAKQESEVEFDTDQISEQEIIDVIAKTGYKAS